MRQATFEPVIPATIHGFSVEVGIGPYPPDSHSHRKAVYATLLPIEDKTRKRMKQMGREKILGMAPLTPIGVRIMLNQASQEDKEMAERMVKHALLPAAVEAKKVQRG